MGEISRRLNLDNLDISACPIEPSMLAWLISLIHSGTILNNGGKTLLQSLWEKQTPGVIDGEFEPLTGSLTGATASSSLDFLIDKLGLRQSDDTSELETIIDTVLASNAKSVEEYKAGNAKAFNALVGQAMKATKGKGNPAQVNELLKKKLG